MLHDTKYLVKRYEKNPILTGDDFPNDIVTVFNAGIIKRSNGRYTMVCRCEDASLGRYMWVADSDDGIHFTPRPKPLQLPTDDPVFMRYCHTTKSYWDPRVTEIEGRYYITHAADVTNGLTCQLGLFEIDEVFEKLTWMGIISEPDNRNGVLFPQRIRGLYYRLDRPNDNSFDIWAASSPDLIHWGNPRRVLARDQLFWADQKIGPGAVPIRTDKGWLCIIHGVRRQCADQIYSLGAMLLDLEDPTKLVGLCEQAILWPMETYELIGQSPSVVFTNGAVVEDDGTIRIYYGAADSVLCLGTVNIDDLLSNCAATHVCQ